MAKTIMIVDDAAFIRVMLRDLLTNAGYEVVAEAANGKEAVEKYMSTSPNVVLLDILMPEMDGLSALKMIMKTDANAKVIMCSAVGQQQNVIESFKNGAKDFIVKPFIAERILESISRVLGEAQAKP